MKLTRKELLSLFLMGAATKLLLACGRQCKGDAVAEISVNHDHRLTVTAADINEGGIKFYSIKGISEHDHTVRLEDAHFADLRTGTAVIVMSTSNGHSHKVTLASCS